MFGRGARVMHMMDKSFMHRSNITRASQTNFLLKELNDTPYENVDVTSQQWLQNWFRQWRKLFKIARLSVKCITLIGLFDPIEGRLSALNSSKQELPFI